MSARLFSLHAHASCANLARVARQWPAAKHLQPQTAERPRPVASHLELHNFFWQRAGPRVPLRACSHKTVRLYGFEKKLDERCFEFAVLRVDEGEMRRVWSSARMKRRGGGISPRKPADQCHHSARFPRAKIRQQPRLESNPFVVVPSMGTNPFSDKLHEALVTDLVSHWLPHAAKNSLLVGPPAGRDTCVLLAVYGLCALFGLRKWYVGTSTYMPSTSTRSIAQVGVSHSTVWDVLSANALFPYYSPYSVWPAGWVMLLWNAIATVIGSPIPAPKEP
ncbi:hypothetical protein PR048_019634 [Dryococelus australis]|uniref:Uncharacterized protein n=1 Tax=Dryococelus australis TaxID=614101 RepID=A0ABQ9H413_9NEOP|nr:hypothetical protein PR048_019634 [Dryococelus australis]